MKQSHKNSLVHILSGAIGGLITMMTITALVVAYPIDAANILTRMTNGQPGTAQTSGAIVPEPANTTAADSEHTVTNVVKRVSPAVVNITMSQQVAVNQPFDPFYQFFGIPSLFGNTPQQNTPQQTQDQSEPVDVGGGTGFLVSSDGYIVTNRHVVDQTGVQFRVTTTDGKDHSVKIIATDPLYDIAILKIDGNNYPHLNFGDSGDLQVGQSVIAIGNALAEFQNTVSVGVISGLSRTITAGSGLGDAKQLSQLIQTDAAINPGNSGGPLLDLNGDVIGVNAAMAGAQNIGFALPANIVKSVSDSVIKNGKIVRPYLGIRYIPVTSDLQSTNKLPVDYGALILRGTNLNELAVQPGSPADKAGLAENDIVLEIDGIKLDDGHSLATLVRTKNPGDTITMQVVHDGKAITTKATLGEYPQ